MTTWAIQTEEGYSYVHDREIDVRLIIYIAFEEQVDTEVWIGLLVPSYYIEVYVPGDQKYECRPQKISLSRIRLALQKDHGVSMVGNATITLSNITARFSESDASSIFYGEQIIKDWLRVRSGWGADYSTDIQTQYQGSIKRLETTEDRNARIVAYDAIKKLIDYEFDADVTVSSSEVASMNPAAIVEYLIKDVAGIQFFDMDSLANEDLLDATDLAIARDRCSLFTISSTTISTGARLINVLQDMMKIVHGYMYGGQDGKLHLFVYDPTGVPASPKAFTGDETASPRQVLKSMKWFDEDDIINQVIWIYGSSSTEMSPISDTASIAKYGIKPKEFRTMWNVSEADLIATTDKIFARFAEPPRYYQTRVSWVEDGEAMKCELGEVIKITDPGIHEISRYMMIVETEKELDNQTSTFTCEDAGAMRGKFFLFCSENDERDGKGITASGYVDNWEERFFYFGNADVGDPHYQAVAYPGFDFRGNQNGVINDDYPPIDRWGNGIEENFAFA